MGNMVRRLPAEWEDQDAIMMAFPHEHTDWNDILDEAREQFARIIGSMVVHGEKILLLTPEVDFTTEYMRNWFEKGLGTARLLDKVRIINVRTNDTWTRDYGPIGVAFEDGDTVNNHVCDFGFNAWGLKFAANLDNQVNHTLYDEGLIQKGVYEDNRDFILEGGSLESDGKGTLLTTSECLLSPNRNPTYDKVEIERILCDRLGIKRVLWLDHGHIEGDDTDSHIDTLCRFAPNDVILYTGTGDSYDENSGGLRDMMEQLKTFRTESGKPYHLVELPLPDPIYDNEGNRLGATYANFLITPRCIYMPTYNQSNKDCLAAMTLQSVFNDREIVPIDCSTLIKQGGSLHCSTMQIAPGILS